MNVLKQISGIVFIAALLGFFPADASNVSVSTKLDTNQMLIGDQVKLAIEITRDPRTQIFWPDPGNSIKVDSTREIEIISTRLDTIKKAGVILESRTYILTVFDSGYYVIPPLTVQYKSGEDALMTLASEPMLLTVKTVEVDTVASFKPLKEPLTLPFSIREILKELLIGAAVLILLAGVILFLSLRKRKPVVIKKFVRKEPPHEIAFRKLRELDEKKLWQQGEVKEYYSAISEIIREYIENRWNIPALESTTDEIMDRITVTGIRIKTREQLFVLLQTSDLVKFAKGNPLAEEHQRFMEFSNEFIRMTKTEEEAHNEIIEEKA